MVSTFALSYLLGRAVFRVVEFFRRWYADGTRAFLRLFESGVRSIEDTIAVRITLHLFFQPLFGDYTIVGRILGPIFRAGRLLVGLCAYLTLAVGTAAAWILWLALPPLLIFYAAVPH